MPFTYSLAFHATAAGANAYLTPRGTQGLAPHTDPVEIFVVQTQGRKRWRLYAPVGGFPLPNQASGDLEQVGVGVVCVLGGGRESKALGRLIR